MEQEIGHTQEMGENRRNGRNKWNKVQILHAEAWYGKEREKVKKKKIENGRIYKTLLLLLALVACGVFLYRAGMVKGASGSVPGSVSDPLVTKSYLEQQLAQVSGGSGAFLQVSLSKGDSVQLPAGSEVMIYSGNATVTGNDGLVNLTSGELFKSGNSLVRYNLYLSPSASSGLTASGSVIIFIRGSYTKK